MSKTVYRLAHLGSLVDSQHAATWTLPGTQNREQRRVEKVRTQARERLYEANQRALAATAPTPSGARSTRSKATRSFTSRAGSGKGFFKTPRHATTRRSGGRGAGMKESDGAAMEGVSDSLKQRFRSWSAKSFKSIKTTRSSPGGPSPTRNNTPPSLRGRVLTPTWRLKKQRSQSPVPKLQPAPTKYHHHRRESTPVVANPKLFSIARAASERKLSVDTQPQEGGGGSRNSDRWWRHTFASAPQPIPETTPDAEVSQGQVLRVSVQQEGAYALRTGLKKEFHRVRWWWVWKDGVRVVPDVRAFWLPLMNDFCFCLFVPTRGCGLHSCIPRALERSRLLQSGQVPVPRRLAVAPKHQVLRASPANVVWKRGGVVW